MKSLMFFIFLGFSPLSAAFLLNISNLSILVCSFKALTLAWYLILVNNWMTSLLMSGHILFIASSVLLTGSFIFSSFRLASFLWTLLKALSKFLTFTIICSKAQVSPLWICIAVPPIGSDLGRPSWINNELSQSHLWQNLSFPLLSEINAHLMSYVSSIVLDSFFIGLEGIRQEVRVLLLPSHGLLKLLYFSLTH